MSAKRAEKTSLEIKRFLNVPRNRVYEAWTDPVQLRQWFGPESVRTRDLVAETRVGGKFRWDLTNPEGEEMTVQGEYSDLQPGRKIVFTWQWQDDETWENHNSLVTVELLLPSEESRDNHNDGWKSLLNKLDKFLSEKAPGKR